MGSNPARRASLKRGPPGFETKRFWRRVDFKTGRLSFLDAFLPPGLPEKAWEAVIGWPLWCVCKAALGFIVMLHAEKLHVATGDAAGEQIKWI